MAKRKRQKRIDVSFDSKQYDTLRVVFAFFFALIALFTLVSLISYIFSWSSDQSLSHNPNFFNQSVRAANGGGKLGFIWSDLLISKWFGLGAFIFPIYFALMSIYCFRLKKFNVFRITTLALSGAIILSLFFSYIFSFTPFDAWLGNGVGGSYGHYVIAWLSSMLGSIGSGLLVVFLLLVWIVSLPGSILSRIVSMLRRKRENKGVDIEGEESGSPIVAIDEMGELTPGDSGREIENDLPDLTLEILSDGYEPQESDQSQGKADKKEKEVKEVKGDDVEMEILDPDEDFTSKYTEDQLKTLFDPRLDLAKYKVPPMSLLNDYKDQVFIVSQDELEKNKSKIVRTLSDYKIGVSRIGVRIGPTVTLYEIVPAPGVRVAQIKRLEEDIALSLAARGVRVVTLVGTNAIGIEVANENPSIVSMLSVLDDPKFKSAKYDLPVVMGRTISNDILSFDLAKMPHLLVAGATGQGKSVGLNAILTSLLYRKHPSELKLVLVDPKKVELSLYSKLEKHFLAMLPDADEPIITDTQKVIYTLKSLCQEMDSRYDLLKAAHVRNIKEYNEKFLSRRLNPLKGHRFLPFIVVIIDEFADLLMTAGREIEEPIARLAQLARAIGIHLVIATQRPTTNIITGTIKANFPARIAFRVISSIDSKTILDQTGANQLIGRGDMLISTGSELTRVQCAFIDTKEVEDIAEYIGAQKGYPEPFYLPEYEGEDGGGSGVGDIDLGKRDKLFEEAAKLIVQYQQGSTSLIQRKMNLGYNRAGRIIDQLEAAGIVGPYEGSKARQVLVTDFTSLDRILASLD